ncbi:hypothetical protein BcepSauron_165 [Burkholderia phage BcepSauron]|uniref:Uncharacterized protein n=1 Tax=Burkholderia phage BcepSauron TaxID=2530033 RepID=A0A482MLN4_9CAUD|nr:hypothetical protein H1O17_gp165 [Burkholderia phage BcepSauron]QBQ74545.1 hypothetical protein BcepSauron_165 [Burkholderia phage BcepSauron]
MENNQRVVDSTFDRMQARNGLTAKNQSQLGKLIPMLQLGSKNGKEPRQIIDGLQKRVDDIRALLDDSNTAFRRLPGMGSVSKERQMKRLTDALKAVREFRARGLPQGTSVALRAVKNELTSLREIAYLGELNESSVDLSAISKWRSLLEDLYRASVARLQEQSLLLSGDRDDGPGDRLSESELKDPVFASNLGDVINSVTGARDSLPKCNPDHAFTMGRTSVVPVPATIMDDRILRARGFKFDSLGGYVVLRDQVLISINPKSNLTVDGVLKRIRKETKQRYATVTSRPMPHAGASWYWIMRESELDDFASAFSGRSLQLRNWGFC